MRKNALLVGINRYKVPGADLRGCVNDVKNLQRVLTRYLGFKKANIKTLLDLKATKRNIESGIRRLLQGAKRGDVLLFHFSGHGSHVPDQSGDEPDFRDEIICPTDLDWDDPLLDDWLREQFDTVPDGVNLTVIMDCCHSGTNTRVISPPDERVKERYLPSPWALGRAESRKKLPGKLRDGLVPNDRLDQRSADVALAGIPEVLITGCRDTQTSADAYIAGSFNGALTYHLCKVIEGRKGKLSYRELHQDTNRLLKKGQYTQVSQLEGQEEKFDRQFLSSYEEDG